MKKEESTNDYHLKQETMSDRVEGESCSQSDELDQTQQEVTSTDSVP